MNTGRTVLSQLLDFVSRYGFDKCVDKYQGNYRVKSFTCWEQFVVMSFAQLTGRESLRDIESCLGAISSKLYHSGVKSDIKKSTLADANEKRDWRIYAEFAQLLIQEARGLYKERWKIELFFKWIKQHLRIKKFLGTTLNAVYTQIWIAVSIYLLVAIMKRKLKLEQELYTILQILSICIFEKVPINQLFEDDKYKNKTTKGYNQLNLFDL